MEAAVVNALLLAELQQLHGGGEERRVQSLLWPRVGSESALPVREHNQRCALPDDATSESTQESERAPPVGECSQLCALPDDVAFESNQESPLWPCVESESGLPDDMLLGLSSFDAMGLSSLNAVGSSSLNAVGSSSLNAVGSSSLNAVGSSSLNAVGSSSLNAVGSSSLNAVGSSSLNAVGSSSLNAVGSSSLNAVGSSSLYSGLSAPHAPVPAPLPAPLAAALAASIPGGMGSSSSTGGTLLVSSCAQSEMETCSVAHDTDALIFNTPVAPLLLPEHALIVPYVTQFPHQQPFCVAWASGPERQPLAATDGAGAAGAGAAGAGAAGAGAAGAGAGAGAAGAGAAGAGAGAGAAGAGAGAGAAGAGGAGAGAAGGAGAGAGGAGAGGAGAAGAGAGAGAAGAGGAGAGAGGAGAGAGGGAGGGGGGAGAGGAGAGAGGAGAGGAGAGAGGAGASLAEWALEKGGGREEARASPCTDPAAPSLPSKRPREGCTDPLADPPVLGCTMQRPQSLESGYAQQEKRSRVQPALWPRAVSESALPDDVLLGLSTGEAGYSAGYSVPHSAWQGWQPPCPSQSCQSGAWNHKGPGREVRKCREMHVSS
ncbi:unnamed protein product [Closterium sp. Yama58-4]|nr:unnamed protein product [Closterium sp. Yama58-4]